MTGKGGLAARRGLRRPVVLGRRAVGAQQKKQRGRLARLLRWVLGVLALCALLLLALDRCFRPVIQQFAQTQAKYLAVTTINQAIDAELQEHPVEYAQLVNITRGPAGQVQALEIDPAAVNNISSRLTLAANAALNGQGYRRVRIPLGTVLGIQVLAGRGPLVDIYIQPTSYVESNFLSTLEGAGFNQTMHGLVLRMTVTVETFAVGYHTTQVVTSDMILAQTVIVGDVPEFYTQNTN